jgi:putative glutamine amidotransferase
MPPRIAIPMPHSTDHEYGDRAIPQYERAVALVGGEPVRIMLDQTPAEIKELIDHCDGVLLPGSNADIDPARFRQATSPHTAKADPRRDDVDILLLDDAYARPKPVVGICYGLQSLNVYRRGSLVQHIPEFLPEEMRAMVNHEAGKTVAIAHTVEIEGASRLAEAVSNGKNREGHGLSRADQDRAHERALTPEGHRLIVPVNSSHHQSAGAIGEGLRVVARCPDDGIIEALEGTVPGHFVLAVQWHPERSVDDDVTSLNIFRALIEAANGNKARAL